MKEVLDRFFLPRSVAVIGATVKPEKIGHTVAANLAEFEGAVYPVNPKYQEVLGRRCYARLRDLPGPPDLVVLTTPAATLPGLIEECGKAGIRAALVMSGGFKEAGEEGERRYRALRQQAARSGVRLIGPNSLGLLSPALKLNATTAPALPPAGRLAFISQSGALGAAILDWAAERRVGFSHFVSVGGMADVGFEQLIDYFGTDSHTACILIYMEHLANARKFISAARAFARSKPIVILKAGATEEGARAVLAQSGAAAGNDAVYDAVFRRAGCIRVQTIQQLFDCAQALAYQPLPAGNRLAIVSNAGGPGVLAIDTLTQRGGALAELSDATRQRLGALAAPWMHGNPVYLPANAATEDFRQALGACLADPGVDGALVVLTAQAATDPEAVARAVAAETKGVYGKPVLASWMGARSVRTGRQVLEESRLPWYPFPERAVTVFLHMARYRETLDLLYETPPALPIEFTDIRREEARQIIAQARQEGHTQLGTAESKLLLACYGIPVNNGRSARREEEAVAMARETGFPVAVKIDSPDIWHKSDVHGVRLGIETEAGVRQVYRFLMENVGRKRPDARLQGVIVERMVETQHELLIGSFKDPVFGPCIVFGLGGAATEVWQDRAIGLPPLNLALARHLMESTRIARLLRGYRHLPAVPAGVLETVLCRFAYLLMDFPEIREVEINPFAMNAAGGLALDASITLEDSPTTQRDPFAHLSIEPYPTQWVRPVTLPDGTPVLLRPIRPEDEPLEAELTRRASRESLYFRFFGYVPGIDHKMLARFTHIDYDREMAIVAQIEENGRPQIIGVVRIVGDGWREAAEYAILVADAWHGRGLGSLLTDYILEIARAQGYKRIYASFLKTNRAMRRLFERKGWVVKAGSEEADEAEIWF